MSETWCDYTPRSKVNMNGGNQLVGTLVPYSPEFQPKIGATPDICDTRRCDLSAHGVCPGGTVQKVGKIHALTRPYLGEAYAKSGFCRLRGGTAVFVASE